MATKERLEYDLILVGAGPSTLTLAHKLVDEFKAHAQCPEFQARRSGKTLRIAILDKAENPGGHIVSGAVVTKTIFDKAFPEHTAEGMPIESVCNESHFSILGSFKKWDSPSVITRIALPEFMKEGYYILTLSNVVKWMADTLIEKAKNVPNITVDMFSGFPATEVLFEGNRVIGVTVDRSGDELEDYVYGKAVVFGDKGFLSKDVINRFNLATNPQLWSVGVKETWRLAPDAEDVKGKVWHTLGYPVLDGTLGGGFVYGLDHKRVTIGLVISLDSHNPNIHPQKQLQEYKKHPWLQEMLKGAELLHYGAAVLPEGGLASLPKKFQVNGALLTGDALGLLDMKALAGVDKAMESGLIAAEVLLEAWFDNDFSEAKLSSYQDELMHSPYLDKMRSNRYFRKTFMENPQLLDEYIPTIVDGIDKFGSPIAGAIEIGLKSPISALKTALRANQLINQANDLTEEVVYKPGYTAIDPQFSKELMRRGLKGQDFAKNTVYSREDAVFYANTKYNEHPDHIDEFSADTCMKCIRSYERLNLDVPCVSDCTAEVHRLDIQDGGVKVHGMSLENCVQCRTCELICPEQNLRVNAAYAGSGPDFRGL